MYDINRYGAVNAIRIYEEEDNFFPKADLKFVSGDIITICWTSPSERDEYLPGINGYTYIFDERQSKGEW